MSLVYVNAFAPEPGETCFGLSAMYPGSTLGDTLEPTTRRDGTTDLRIARDRFRSQFCADVPEARAALMEATQRPITREALLEPSGEHSRWKELPSWFVIAELDRNIPPSVQRYMADRAGSQRTIELADASHAAAVSRPHSVTDLILEAAHVAV